MARRWDAQEYTVIDQRKEQQRFNGPIELAVALEARSSTADEELHHRTESIHMARQPVVLEQVPDSSRQCRCQVG